MRFLTRSREKLNSIFSFKPLKNVVCCFFALVFLVLARPSIVDAEIQVSENENGLLFTRSLESLRDIDYQTWQVVVYTNDLEQENLVLRIVGYPGSLRMDHPSSLEVKAGIRNWSLKDITLSNPQLANDAREAAVEFELSPLLNDLNNNRPLRLMLNDAFSDLPVPPYLVSEWRSLGQ